MSDFTALVEAHALELRRNAARLLDQSDDLFAIIDLKPPALNSHKTIDRVLAIVPRCNTCEKAIATHTIIYKNDVKPSFPYVESPMYCAPCAGIKVHEKQTSYYLSESSRIVGARPSRIMSDVLRLLGVEVDTATFARSQPKAKTKRQNGRRGQRKS